MIITQTYNTKYHNSRLHYILWDVLCILPCYNNKRHSLSSSFEYKMPYVDQLSNMSPYPILFYYNFYVDSCDHKINIINITMEVLFSDIL